MPLIEILLCGFLQTNDETFLNNSLSRSCTSPVGAVKCKVTVWGKASSLKSKCCSISVGTQQSCHLLLEMLLGDCGSRELVKS